MVAANNGPNRSCSLALKESKTNFQGSGRFDYGRFVDATQVGSYSYDLHCVDTSFGYPVTQLFGAGMYVLAKRLVGCTPPQHEVSSPETAMCVGLSQPVVQLKNLGPVDKNSPRADRIIEATVTNAANGNAPIGGLTITLDVVTDTTKGDAGLLLSTTYPSQYWPGSSTRAITDSTGKTTATFSWPPSLRPAPVQRIRGCDLSGLCTGTLDIPLDPSVVIGFFNGVWNTEDDALGGLRRLEREFGPAHNDSPLKYELFYNQTGCGDRWYQKGACMKDVAEVFIQRSAEIDNQVWGDRWEIFWELLAGTHTRSDSFTSTLLGYLGGVGNGLLQLLDTTFNAFLNQIVSGWSQLLSSPPTAADQTTHIATLQAYADQGAAFVLVAHSQGNLFVNAAYDGLKASRPTSQAQVVHVAPASPTLRGDYILSGNDFVILGLNTLGLTSVASYNIIVPPSAQDASGHMLEATYLDTTRNAYARIREMVLNAITAVAN